MLIIGHGGEAAEGVLVNDDLDEPTMGEKLASLNLMDNDRADSHKKQESSKDAKPPSADSVHVLLKQALHADDRALLFDCLYTQDEKVSSCPYAVLNLSMLGRPRCFKVSVCLYFWWQVILKSVSLLNPSDVLKLLQSLISIIQSRYVVKHLATRPFSWMSSNYWYVRGTICKDFGYPIIHAELSFASCCVIW